MSTAKILPEKNMIKSSPGKSGIIYHQSKIKGLEIQKLVHNAAQSIAPVWPLETFIACNPLQGYESLQFHEALAQAQFLRAKAQVNPALERVNQHMIKWCSGFFDAGQSGIEMPHRDKGFYLGFLKLAIFDKQLHQNKREAKDFLKQLPKSPAEAINMCLLKLQVRGKEEAFLSRTLLYLPGWAGFVKWKTDWQSTARSEENPVTLVDFLAVRLVLTCLLWPAAVDDEIDDIGNRGLVKEMVAQLKIKEDIYRKKLVNQIVPAASKAQVPAVRKNAQLVFCIDVRSEPFRRALESLGNYETFGFAGFFGIPVRVNAIKENKAKECCPVLLTPRYEIKETPIAAHEHLFVQYQRGRFLSDRFKNLYYHLKHNFSTPFALVESLGLWCGLGMAIKSLAPRLSQNFMQSLKNRFMPAPPTKISYELDEDGSGLGISLEEQITYAETVLRLMGLTSCFAKLIVFCGHGSTTKNNPYASALDCGACGGNHGGINAQLLASILNKPEVRRGLEDRGMHIPLDTVFYGALHNTTTDQVEIYTQHDLRVIYPQLLEELRADLLQAKVITNQERGVKLSSATPYKDLERKSWDWSETRPEWGLARNAAFIVAPRWLTKNTHLDGRCFLHSYLWEQDNEGTLLETILTAPMVVAQWINTQYLFSTLDNVAYGSGSKITHNVVGKIGVMQGNGSDLMHGLPLQSVMSSDEHPYHEPQRLLTVVYAPKEMVSRIIEKQQILKTLFYNEWVSLLVIDPSDNAAYQLTPSGAWIVQN